MNTEKVILYHGDCQDGLGGAYVAWKKFGDDATYIPVSDRIHPPPGLEGKEVYLIDFSYSKEILLNIEKEAKRLVILDHHIGVREAIESVREHVFNNNRSGTGIAWEYFNPGKPIPRLLGYIEDGDIWKYALSDMDAVKAFLSTLQDLSFEKLEGLLLEFEDDEKFKNYVELGRVYFEHYELLCKSIAEEAELVEFDGYRVYAVNCPRTFRSRVGHILADKQPPFSIAWRLDKGMWHFSLRGNGSVDLTKIAAKYGGSGHFSAAAFRLPIGSPLPFKLINK